MPSKKKVTAKRSAPRRAPRLSLRTTPENISLNHVGVFKVTVGDGLDDAESDEDRVETYRNTIEALHACHERGLRAAVTAMHGTEFEITIRGSVRDFLAVAGSLGAADEITLSGILAHATGAPFEHHLYLGYQFAAAELMWKAEREERARLKAEQAAKRSTAKRA